MVRDRYSQITAGELTDLARETLSDVDAEEPF